LKLLEEKELIRRERCELDGRARRVHLTAKGRRLQKKLIRNSDKIHERMDDAISAKERKLMFSMLDRLTAVVSQEQQKVG
jgi:DNA-binding MarR family transcriptional regulator